MQSTLYGKQIVITINVYYKKRILKEYQDTKTSIKKILYMEKQNNFTKNVSFEFLSPP